MGVITNHVFIDGAAGVAEASEEVNCKQIMFVTNDHVAQDLIINFDDATDGPNAITLKAGESLDLWPETFDVSTIYYKGSAAGTTFRFLGIRR